MDKSKWGVHETHCCPIHGCKYDDTDCPVATHKTPAEYMCEDCDEMWAEYDTYTVYTANGRKDFGNYKDLFNAVNELITWNEPIVDIMGHTQRSHSIMQPLAYIQFDEEDEE